MKSTDEYKFEEILLKLPEKDRKYLKKAYDFSKQAHDKQLRKSGEPYFIHPLAVCIELYGKFQDIELSAAGLLHDTIEDCEDITQEIIYKEFGDNVGFIVDSISKNEKCFFGEKLEFNDERDKMLYGGMRNIGCLLVKIADRNHNLATLSHMPANKQVKKSFESQAIYIPLMHLLDYNKCGINIERSKEYLKNYIDTNNINSYESFKNKLMNHCFNDFNEDLFNLVYNNSSNVSWGIYDRKFFNSLVECGWFDGDGPELRKVESRESGYFRATFSFKNGTIFNNIDGKMKMLETCFIS